MVGDTEVSMRKGVQFESAYSDTRTPTILGSVRSSVYGTAAHRYKARSAAMPSSTCATSSHGTCRVPRLYCASTAYGQVINQINKAEKVPLSNNNDKKPCSYCWLVIRLPINKWCKSPNHCNYCEGYYPSRQLFPSFWHIHTISQKLNHPFFQYQATSHQVSSHC